MVLTSELRIRMSLQKASAAARREIRFAARREMRHAGHDLAVLFQADQRGPDGNTAHVITSAVDGVDDPPAAAARGLHRAFFAQQAVIGKRFFERQRDHLLAFAIRFGDGRIVGFGIISNAMFAITQRDFAGLQRHGPAHIQFPFK